MAIQVGGTTVIDNSRNLCNVVAASATCVCGTTCVGSPVICGTTFYGDGSQLSGVSSIAKSYFLGSL